MSTSSKSTSQASIPADVGRDAHLESVIPRRLMWAADAGIMTGAILAAYLAAPMLQRLLVSSGLIHVAWLDRLAQLPAGPTSSVFRPVEDILVALCILVPMTALLLNALGAYRPVERQSRTRLFLSTLVAPVFALSLFTLLLFALHSTGWSRTLLFSYTALTFVGLLSYRTVLRVYKRRRQAQGRYRRSVAFVGEPDDVDEIVARMQAPELESVYQLVGFFGVDRDTGPMSRLMFPHLGHVSELSAALVHTPIDLVVVIQPDAAAPWLKEVLRACDYFKVSVQIIPAALLAVAPMLVDLYVPVHQDPLAVPSVILKPSLTDSDALFLKRLFDGLVSLTLLIVLSPLLLLIAIAIKVTTPGLPVFFRWRVVGYKGRPFVGYKFTTMEAGAETRLSDLMHLNEMQGPVFKIKQDPRVTRLGRFLRKHSLNELPQLWSVLKGDMSLVGPRPVFPHELAGYEIWHKRKLSVRPGITCLWQVSGRNQISDFDDWVRLDLEYIDNWSLWLDFRILVRTAWAVLAGSGS
jgi:exopolysaccharide biosynthesis polyprenyl glycosylphosphotransferase